MKTQIRITWSGVRALTIGAVLVAGGFSQSSQAQLSKGWQIILRHGVLVEGMILPANGFHSGTYQSANYNAECWLSTPNAKQMGQLLNLPWGRWVDSVDHMPPLAGEAPSMSGLVTLQLGDEWNLQDGPTFTNLVHWFNTVQKNYPNTILYHNNYGGQAPDDVLSRFISLAHPDMICFDSYPFTCDYKTRVPIGGPFTGWYNELRRYRAWGQTYGIPTATYLQTFNAVEDYDQHIYRDPSPSELRLNASVALLFNAKALIDFTYNTGASSLFVNDHHGGGDNPARATPLFAEKRDVNKRAVNLGKTLARLTPVDDLHNKNDAHPPPGPASNNPHFPDGATTGILILKANPGTATNSPEPIGFQDNPASPKSYSWWEFGANDPGLIGWKVANKGTVNGGSPGQVFIAWFRPIVQNLAATGVTNQIYMMVVNGLTSLKGPASDCRQEILMDFAGNLSSVVLLDPETGNLSTNAMPLAAPRSTKHRLKLELNGGDAALFKFADGAPFVGHE